MHGNIWAAAAVCEYASEQLKLSSYACTLVMKQVITALNFDIFQSKYNGMKRDINMSTKISKRARVGDNPNSLSTVSSLLSFMLYKREDSCI